MTLKWVLSCCLVTDPAAAACNAAAACSLSFSADNMMLMWSSWHPVRPTPLIRIYGSRCTTEGAVPVTRRILLAHISDCRSLLLHSMPPRAATCAQGCCTGACCTAGTPHVLCCCIAAVHCAAAGPCAVAERTSTWHMMHAAHSLLLAMHHNPLPREAAMQIERSASPCCQKGNNTGYVESSTAATRCCYSVLCLPLRGCCRR